MNTAPEATAAHRNSGYLRRLLDTQPGCLLRADADSRLLAVNDAALRLLGAADLAAVLGRPLLEFVPAEHQSRWREFTGRLSSGASSSVECDLEPVAGARRQVQLQGTPLLDHPDGVPSFIIAAQDISAARRLEETLAARTREIDAYARALASARAEGAHLRKLLAERQAELQSVVRTLDAPMRRAIDELRSAAGAVASLTRHAAMPSAIPADEGMAAVVEQPASLAS